MAVMLRFDRDKSYFPLAGKLSDKFNGNFKLTATAEVTEPEHADIGFAVLWKGRAYLFRRATVDFPKTGTYEIAVRWREEASTIAEFLEALYEELPKETTRYTYSWLVGLLSDQQIAVHDRWDTSLLVEVPSFPWEIVVPVAGLAVLGLGVYGAYYAARKPAVVEKVA